MLHQNGRFAKKSASPVFMALPLAHACCHAAVNRYTVLCACVIHLKAKGFVLDQKIISIFFLLTIVFFFFKTNNIRENRVKFIFSFLLIKGFCITKLFSFINFVQGSQSSKLNAVYIKQWACSICNVNINKTGHWYM